ncbi:MAG: tetratricopeptide repeat protein [Microcystaceae cyanobacterium]
MKNLDLKAALSDYQVALDKVQKTKKKSSHSDIIAVLVARDRVQEALQVTTLSDQDIFVSIMELDQTWKQQSAWVTKTIDLEEWRKSFAPPESAWWWYLEQPIHHRDSLDWLWQALSIGCLTIALSLALNISSRFLNGGTDALGAFTITAQTLLTLLTAKSTLTPVGEKSIRRVLISCRIPSHWVQEVELTLSILLLLSIYGLFSSLPEIGTYYRSKGLESYNAGYLATAQANYHRALSLNPGDVSSNFYLGVLYEDMQNYKKAKEQYQIATARGYLPAYNNLARLYIVEKKYTDASVLLERQKLRGMAAEDKELNYAYYKNLGWIQLKQERLPVAKVNLQQAIGFNHDQASAHCLLAQVLEKEKQSPETTIVHWEKCLAFANAVIPEETDWMALAQERLTDFYSAFHHPQ